MPHYLIYDGGCCACRQIADTIDHAAAGKITPLSIQGADARQLLDRVYPEGWTHAPYLIVEQGSSLRAYSGPRLALRLGVLLGPRRAWRVWRRMRAQRAPSLSVARSVSRRYVLKLGAVFGLAAGGAAALPAGPAFAREPCASVKCYGSSVYCSCEAACRDCGACSHCCSVDKIETVECYDAYSGGYCYTYYSITCSGCYCV